MPEGVKSVTQTQWTAEIYDLLKAYSDIRRRTLKVSHVVKARSVWSIKDARNRLERLVGESPGDWLDLDFFLKRYLAPAGESRTVLAASFGASLEMAREGLIELRQDAPYAPIYMRKCETGALWQRLG
jgi:segregation and condensation protein A